MPKQRLSDRVAVITGASSGIGRAAALAFADQGAAVALVARRAEALEELAEECRGRGVDALCFPADVTEPAAMDEVASDVVGRFGRLDIWVNNAAVNLFGPVEEVPVEAWHRVIETNLFGTYHGIRSALPWMREQGQGTIINVASVLSKVAAPQQGAYVASKHAVRGLSDVVRQEVQDLPGLHVCTVLPGPIDTPLFQTAGNHAGREVVPITPVIDAGRVADAIVDCALHPRREVVVGASSSGLMALTRLLPGSTERAVARQVRQDHFSDRLHPATDGNLFEPADGPTTITGGWDRSGRQVGTDSKKAVSVHTDGSKARAVAVLAGSVAAGAAVLARRRSS
jgi:NAD(P)-dependent dehydrogenase (short-subunit alcohol dehydrogenase family)